MNSAIDSVTEVARSLMFKLATLLNSLSGGRISPNAITWTGLIMHIPIAYLISKGDYRLAALLLIIFGLFDVLDGAMAKVQKRVGNAGMLLDASTDRIKEVLLYVGVAYAISAGDNPKLTAWAVAACGASLCVSYIKAKGETAVRGKLTPNEVNRLFSDGIFRFQVRMLILILGLLTGELIAAVIIIAIFSSLTALGRLFSISKHLS